MLVSVLLLGLAAALKAPTPPAHLGRGAVTGAAALATAALLGRTPEAVAAGNPAMPADGRLTADPLAHWSFFGLAPPPISGSLTYDELLARAEAGQVASVQIAVQHDCVVATTLLGHRLACEMPDSLFPRLLLDSMKPDGS